MPVEIEFDKPPAGYAAEAKRSGEDRVAITVREFTSTEDGQHFIRRLEGFPDEVLQKVPNRLNPSQVDSMLVIIRRDGRAIVYINEIMQQASVRCWRPMEAGQGVFKDDISDIDRIDIGVDIPSDAGFLFLFSIGWRKGLIYDFAPIPTRIASLREYDVGVALAQVYCHVLFQERFSISDEEWGKLFAAKWFPFAGLTHDQIESLIQHIRAGWDPDDKIEDIVVETKRRLPQMMDKWRGHRSFSPHMNIVGRAVERLLENDPVSCTGLLFPRIEGILRTHSASLDTSDGVSQSSLAELAVSSKVENERSLLLPRRFLAYLNDVYFAGFDPKDANIAISRNSVGHGVASESEFSQKSAVISLLIVHQLFLFLDSGRSVVAD